MSEYMSALDAVVAEERNDERHTTWTTAENMVLSIINNPENANKSSHELTKLISDGFKHFE